MQKLHTLSSVQVNLPQEISKEIFNWGQKYVPDKELFVDISNLHYGREDELHVTVLYGLHSVIPPKTLQTNPFSIILGKIGVFTNNDSFDVLKIDVKSEELLKMNAFMKNFPFTSKFDTYVPHITIAYLKKCKAWRYNGIDTFQNRQIEVKDIFFCSKDGKRYIFRNNPDTLDLQKALPEKA